MSVVVEEELQRIEEEEEAIEAPIEGIRKVEKALLLAEGDCYEALIEEIELGRLGDFIKNPPPQYSQNWDMRRNKLAYRFKLVVPEYDLEGYDIITVSARPNSRMHELATCYGSSLTKGAKVYVCVVNGKLKIKCPPAQRGVKPQ